MRLSAARPAWRLPGLFAALIVLSARPAAPQFTPFPSDPAHVLEGNWQSCLQRDGSYSERVYDHVVNGVGQYEVHLGPRREFAIFEGVQDEHRPHASPANLLGPDYSVAMQGSRARRVWEVPSLNLKLTATLAGGSRTDCDSWFVLLELLKKTS
ncbi:MAG: hypothetical protein IT176_01380 [Acidobacteria bacterium]|nr:hypothetical protein [Acidobacteriota bacterium]